MKKLRKIVFMVALLLSSWMVAGVNLVSSDPNWLGGTDRFSMTEGNDFWLTFMNNNMVNPDDDYNRTNPEFKFDMFVALSAREDADVCIAVGEEVLATVKVNAGTTVIYEIEKEKAKDIYLLESEKDDAYKGVHVYSAPSSPENKKKVFSCFLYSRVGASGESSRDASYVLPTVFLGKEYVIQTSPEDIFSSEFAIVATDDGTLVRITPTVDTYAGQTAGTPFDVQLSRGEAFLVASKQHVGNEDFNVNLSGTMVCSNKPIAVFNGNQQTSLPIDESTNKDFAVEQALPIDKWGKEFYVALLDSTKLNTFIITAAFDGTTVDIYTSPSEKETHVLNAGQSYPLTSALKLRPELSELAIRSTKPVMCYDYLTSAQDNDYWIGPKTSGYTARLGDPANAMLPAWEHRVKSVNFFTQELDPQKLSGETPPQIYRVFLVTRIADAGTIKLDGYNVPISQFTEFNADPDNQMAYAYLTLNKNNYHLIETTGEGFIGMVYALSHAQGYLYTLGFTPPNPADSLYVTNTEEVTMSHGSYDLDSVTGHGWYQRQWTEWMEKKERLDTAVVCDSSYVYWAVETPAEKPITKIEWSIFDVTDGKKIGTNSKRIDFLSEEPADGIRHAFNHYFILPEEDPDKRHQFFEYEIQAVLFRNRLMCADEQCKTCPNKQDIDTMKTTVRVTRIYNDTIYRVVCVGDTLTFFYDSLYNQSDLTQFTSDSASTKFIGVKKGEGNGYLKPWHYQVQVDEDTVLFSRHYLSQAGCDSTITLVLMVCDTFQFFDTIHLCDNQDTLYHERLIRGSSYTAPDTADIVVPFKTDSCACQRTKMIERYGNKFRDKNGKLFNGCDSTYYLNLIVHPSYLKQFRDTLCLNPDGTGSYTWTKARGGLHGRTFTEQDLKWSDADGALKGVFRDSTYTSTCAECNDGKHGCDSVHELTLIMPPSYYTIEPTVEYCKLHYDAAKHDTVHNYFTWHNNGMPIEIKTSGTYRDECTTTRYGCDSVAQITVTYKSAKEMYYLTEDTVCFDSTAVYQWKDEKGNVKKEIPLFMPEIVENKRCTTLYEWDENHCDTVYALHLTVLPKYYIVDKVLINQEQAYTWEVNGKTYGGSKTTEQTVPKPDSIVNNDILLIRSFTTTPVGTKFCDSIRILDLRVGNVFRDTTDTFTCGQETQYVWMGIDHNGDDSVRMIIPEDQLPAPGTYVLYQDPHETRQGFDSIYYLNLYRAPSHDTTLTYAEECQSRYTSSRYIWEGHEGRKIYDKSGYEVPFIPLTWDGDYYYIDTLTTTQFGCDSICRLHLKIHPYYDKNADLQICQFEPFVWEDLDAAYTAPDSILDADGVKLTGPIPTNHIGDYEYTLKFHSVHDCDSAWHLKLHIDTVYLEPVETTERVMCDNDTLHFLGDTIYGVNSPLKPDDVPGVSVPGTDRWFVFERSGDTLTVNGCDSAVLHRITLYRTYKLEYHEQRCQPNPSTGESTVISWTRDDTADPEREIWDVQRARRIVASQIPINVSPGEYIYVDSMRTNACETCQGIGGCDSIHILYLQVDSAYYIRQQLKLCDNDTVSWQGHHFKGAKFKGNAAGYRELKSDTTYRDTVEYTSKQSCDSIYYLTLRVAPTYNDTITYQVCDNDSTDAAHIYEFRDKQGHYYVDTVKFSPTKSQQGKKKEDKIEYVQRSLQTIEQCDSLVTYKIIIHPSYKFIETGKVCAESLPFIWRDREIAGTGTYLIQDYTEDGCDSVFELDFYVKPYIAISIYDNVCDNHTYWHRDTIGETIYETEVWHPGAQRPDEERLPVIPLHFTGSDGCDSIVYQYHLTVCPTYNYATDTNGLCLGKPVEYTFVTDSRVVTHTWYGPAFEFDVDTFVVPFDTVFTDSLLTRKGCDSIFVLNALAYPSYRNIVHDTICANDTYTWVARDARPDSILSDLEPGIHFLRDSFLTLDGCDSIYETQVHVNPYYFAQDTLTLCADDTLRWRDRLFEHMAPGIYQIDDELKTHLGCDSIFHLHLTVFDTTYQVNFDSICIGDTLFVNGHMYTQPGDYKDTVENEDGCHHFIYTRLAIIPPTVPTVWAEAPMCNNEKAFDLYYTYTSHYPVAYSVYFDSIAHSMGFVDIMDEPIDPHSYKDTMTITVPMPYRDNDPTGFPRPDFYSVRLELDNGICHHKETDCIHDSMFMMSYPKWLTEQRFGDVIAILNDTKNGGYTWSSYQWYKDDVKLPGQTQPYLYIPTGLEVGARYHVELVRDGEIQEFPTCPVTIVSDPISNKYAPTMGYLSVVPTCVPTSYPYINILSRKDGNYRISTTEGVMVKEGVFRADVTQVYLPVAAGMYIVQLWSNDTPEEPYRAIKIVLRDKCETCATSF